MPIKDRVSYNNLVKHLYLLDKESRVILSNFPDNAHGLADMERVKQLIHDFREHNGLQHKEFDTDVSFAWLPLYSHFDRTEKIELDMYYRLQKHLERIAMLKSADYMQKRNPTYRRKKKDDKRPDDPFAGEEPIDKAENGFGDIGLEPSDNP